MTSRRRIGSIALVVILLASLLAIFAYAMSNGSNPIGPSTPVPGSLPTATPNVISPNLNRVSSNRWVTPGWLYNTVTSTNSLGHDIMYLFPIRIQYPQTWTGVAVGVNTAAVNGIGRICAYNLDSVIYSDSGVSPGTLAHDFGTFNATTTGTKTIVDTFIPDISASAGFYFMGVVVRGDTFLAMRTFQMGQSTQAPITPLNTGPGGGQRLIGLSTIADSNYIDVGCPSDISSDVLSVVGSSEMPVVWIEENG